MYIDDNLVADEEFIGFITYLLFLLNIVSVIKDVLLRMNMHAWVYVEKSRPVL